MLYGGCSIRFCSKGVEMPYYSYRCNRCGFQDEMFSEVKNRDKSLPCEQEGCTGNMIREFEAPAFQLKGDGWYKDGYTKKPKKEEKNENS